MTTCDSICFSRWTLICCMLESFPTVHILYTLLKVLIFFCYKLSVEFNADKLFHPNL